MEINRTNSLVPATSKMTFSQSIAGFRNDSAQWKQSFIAFSPINAVIQLAIKQASQLESAVVGQMCCCRSLSLSKGA